MSDSLSGQPEPPEEAVEAGARALLDWDADNENRLKWTRVQSRLVLEAVLPVFLAAGWLPPEALERVGWMLPNGVLRGMDAPLGVSMAGWEPVYRRAAGWTPPEGEKT